jgi:arginine deiminase
VNTDIITIVVLRAGLFLSLYYVFKLIRENDELEQELREERAENRVLEAELRDRTK